MIYTLGVNLSHDASLCLLEDNNIIFYLEEERTSRIKRDDFPATIFNEIKKYCKEPLDYVALISAKRVIPEAIDYVKYSLTKHNLIKQETTIHNLAGKHHMCHATNAFFSSGFEDAGCVVIDGSGSETDHGVEIESHFYATALMRDKITCIKTKTYDENNPGSISLGRAFDLVAGYCGFALHGSAGKVMGLAPYGNAKNVPELFTEYGESDSEIITWHEIKLDVKPEDLAARIQEDSLKVSINSIKSVLEYTGCNNICLSGGYFLNCVNNYEYLKEFPGINFYVDPISHDGGTAIGAARIVYDKFHTQYKPQKLKTLYLG